MNISGNTVLITGGGSGIGLALAEALAGRGNQVVICGRRRKRLEAVRARVPEIHTRVCDISVSVARSRKALLGWVLSKFNKLNVLVNNAGIQHEVDFLKGPRDLKEADKEVATNLVAPIHLSALLIPRLRRRRQAAIVNISSGLAFTPLAFAPVYCATKAAVHSWSLSLRHQLRRTPVRVFEIAPPIVATELGGEPDWEEDGDFVMSAQAVASGIVEAMRRNRYEVALGAAAGLRKRREAMFSEIND